MIEEFEIKKIINNTNDVIEKIKDIFEKAKNIKIDFLDFSKIELKGIKKIFSEDSGYISGTLGPFSYIFLKTVVLDSKVNVLSNIYLSDSQFFERIKVSEFSELISRYSEYYLLLKSLEEEKPEIILIDGSLISDLVLSSSFFIKFTEPKERFEILKEEIDLKDIERILNVSYLSDKFVKVISATFPILIKKFLEKVKEVHTLYFVKRPIHSRTISRKFSLENSDLVLILSKVKDSEFFTDIYKEEFKNEIFDLKINLMYYRKIRYGNVYKIEFPDFYDKEDILKEIKYLIFEDSDPEGYPRKLEYSHMLSNVTLEDRNFIEDLLRKILPKEFGSKEVTRYL